MRGSVVRLPLAAIVAFALLGTVACFGALREAPTGAPAPESRESQVSATFRQPADEQAEERAAKLAVLNKVASGEVSAEEALEHLDKLYAERRPQAQWISVTIDEGGGRNSIKMSFPMALGEWGLKMAAQQGREMLRMAGIEAHGDSTEARMMQKALEALESPEGTKALEEIIKTLRTAPPGHVLFDLSEGNSRVRVQVE